MYWRVGVLPSVFLIKVAGWTWETDPFFPRLQTTAKAELPRRLPDLLGAIKYTTFSAIWKIFKHLPSWNSQTQRCVKCWLPLVDVHHPGIAQHDWPQKLDGSTQAMTNFVLLPESFCMQIMGILRNPINTIAIVRYVHPKFWFVTFFF